MNANRTNILRDLLAAPRCPACGHVSEVIWVHGHGQCRACGVNVEPCCQGSEVCCENPGEAPPSR